ncbi:conserved protein of unknown function [Tenacibaculum sp. 190130A14a]|uniref:HNH nuclease domain-containing protein n=1 Tax=Tenacibaculum polynesiense TaxID=3137857 RepID=A0ABP1F0Y3_9FLAO
MIKIQEHLNREDSEDYLDSLANRMWENLNKKRVDGEFYEYSLIKKVDKLNLKLLEPDALDTYANNDVGKLERLKSFVSYLQSNECSKLKELIISKPERLLELKREILTVINQDDFSEIVNNKIKQTAFGELLISNLFNYKAFRQSHFCYELLLDANLGKTTCPYCNDGFIRVIDVSDEEDEDELFKAYLDLDHFYPKAQHPYFALSYYNLIPCCHFCNSSEKGDKVFCIETHQHPYYESLNDNYQFKISSRTIIDGLTDSLKLIKNDAYREDFSDSDLKLNQRYQPYLTDVNNFIRLYFNYYNADQYNLGWKEAVLKDIPIETHEILSKKLGKMYRDVYDQIKID